MARLEPPADSPLGSEPIPTSQDVQVIRRVVKDFAVLPFVQARIRNNVVNLTVPFSQGLFWKGMLNCLISSCHGVGPHTRAQRFSEEQPFPLTLDQVRTEGREIIHKRLVERGVSRFPLRVARMASQNFVRLEEGRWEEVKSWHIVLAGQRCRNPNSNDFKAERDAARFVDLNFAGFGPKQSRNLWQILGLTRFEVPIDRRVLHWIDLHLSLKVAPEELLRPTSYERVLNYLQRACLIADIVPCVLDAVVFALGSRELRRKTRSN